MLKITFLLYGKIEEIKLFYISAVCILKYIYIYMEFSEMGSIKLFRQVFLILCKLRWINVINGFYLF